MAGKGASGRDAGGVEQRMDAREAVWRGVQRCIDSVSGVKAMLLDGDTAGIVGLILSQTKALKMQVFAMDRLDNPERKPVGYIKAVCIIRPSQENMRLLKRELEKPNYEEYHLFFTNALPEHMLKDLAMADYNQVVRTVQEVYMDYYPLNSELFSLNIPSCMPLEAPQWDQALFTRMGDGLVSLLLALRCAPTIAYQRNSTIVDRLAQDLEGRIASGNGTNDRDLFRFGTKQPPILLILDRRDDPVTPLLNQWTYTAMLHEGLNIKNNRVGLQDAASARELGGEVVLDQTDDDFYRSAQHLNFGELGESIKKMAEEFQQSEAGSIAMSGGRSKLQSIGDIQRLIERYPDVQRQKGVLVKHVALTSELSRLVDERGLMEMSELEQELACTESLTEAFNKVETLVEDPKVSWGDKLRLVLLYSLRYELEGEREIRFLERSLRDAPGVPDSAAGACALMRRYAGVSVRGCDIFNKQTVVGAARTMVRKHVEGIRGVDNVLTRHQPLLASRLATLKMAGVSGLRESEFRIIGAGAAGGRPQEIIVFIVGGATYAEARCVWEFNRDNAAKGQRVVLGGTTIHNTASFVKEVLAFPPAPT